MGNRIFGKSVTESEEQVCPRTRGLSSHREDSEESSPIGGACSCPVEAESRSVAVRKFTCAQQGAPGAEWAKGRPRPSQVDFLPAVLHLGAPGVNSATPSALLLKVSTGLSPPNRRCQRRTAGRNPSFCSPGRPPVAQCTTGTCHSSATPTAHGACRGWSIHRD